MVITKKLLLRFLLIAEIFLAFLFFIIGPYGMIAVSKKMKEHALLRNNIALEKEEVMQLQKQIECYEYTDFYKEKIARENLQMARPEEEVYVLE